MANAAVHVVVPPPLARVAEGAEPPAEHLLARDVRAAAVRRDTMKAVLDAAAAVELVLNGLLAQELAGLPDVTRSAVQAEHRTLGRLVDLLAKARTDVAERRTTSSTSRPCGTRRRTAAPPLPTTTPCAPP